MRTFLVALLLILFIITPCFAKVHGTPDGQTPHEEDICDGETGAAFGLCNAYCEAMDCDSAKPYASVEACNKIKRLFRKHTGGRYMPCDPTNEAPPGRNIEQPDCPCLYDIPEFGAFLDNPDNFTYCYDTGTGELLGIGDTASAEIFTNGTEEIPICAYFNDDVFQFVEITYEELEICEKLLVDAIENVELYCE
jgi:hypothetical protein